MNRAATPSAVPLLGEQTKNKRRFLMVKRDPPAGGADPTKPEVQLGATARRGGSGKKSDEV